MQIFTDALPIKHSIAREWQGTLSLLVVIRLVLLDFGLYAKVLE